MGELFGLMNLLDSEKYQYEEDFLEKFGGGKDGISLEQVQALQVGPYTVIYCSLHLKWCRMSHT